MYFIYIIYDGGINKYILWVTDMAYLHSVVISYPAQWEDKKPMKISTACQRCNFCGWLGATQAPPPHDIKETFVPRCHFGPFWLLWAIIIGPFWAPSFWGPLWGYFSFKRNLNLTFKYIKAYEYDGYKLSRLTTSSWKHLACPSPIITVVYFSTNLHPSQQWPQSQWKKSRILRSVGNGQIYIPQITYFVLFQEYYIRNDRNKQEIISYIFSSVQL